MIGIFKRLYPCIVCTSLSAGIITQFITAHYFQVKCGAEILWEVPMVLVLCITSWWVTVKDIGRNANISVD